MARLDSDINGEDIKFKFNSKIEVRVNIKTVVIHNENDF
jgi:hypothetical protein